MSSLTDPLASTSSRPMSTVHSAPSTAAENLAKRLETLATPKKRRDSARTFRDINRAVRAGDLSGGVGPPTIIWKEVLQFLAKSDKEYEDWSVDKLKARYYYLKDLRSSFKDRKK